MTFWLWFNTMIIAISLAAVWMAFRSAEKKAKMECPYCR